MKREAHSLLSHLPSPPPNADDTLWWYRLDPNQGESYHLAALCWRWSACSNRMVPVHIGLTKEWGFFFPSQVWSFVIYHIKRAIEGCCVALYSQQHSVGTLPGSLWRATTHWENKRFGCVSHSSLCGSPSAKRLYFPLTLHRTHNQPLVSTIDSPTALLPLRFSHAWHIEAVCELIRPINPPWQREISAVLLGLPSWERRSSSIAVEPPDKAGECGIPPERSTHALRSASVGLRGSQ